MLSWKLHTTLKFLHEPGLRGLQHFANLLVELAFYNSVMGLPNILFSISSWLGLFFPYVISLSKWLKSVLTKCSNSKLICVALVLILFFLLYKSCYYKKYIGRMFPSWVNNFLCIQNIAKSFDMMCNKKVLATEARTFSLARGHKLFLNLSQCKV